MNRRRAPTLALILVTLFAPLCRAQSAAEASKETSRAEVEQCIAQHESARQLRLSEQWMSARAAMISCVDERCPLAIAADCRAWLDELAGLMPTLILVVEGEDLATRHSSLRAELDGTSIELHDPPSPIELLPGAHRLRLELPGRRPIERSFFLEQGEKNHIERIQFAPLKAGAPRAMAPSRAQARPIPVSSYWLSAGALAALTASAGFLVSALHEHADARAICAPTCDHSIRTSIQARLVLADITGGAGLLLGGLAVNSYLRRPVVLSEPRPSGATVVANGQGLSLFWRGHF